MSRASTTPPSSPYPAYFSSPAPPQAPLEEYPLGFDPYHMLAEMQEVGAAMGQAEYFSRFPEKLHWFSPPRSRSPSLHVPAYPGSPHAPLSSPGHASLEQLKTPQRPPGSQRGSPALPHTPKATSPHGAQYSPRVLAGHAPGSSPRHSPLTPPARTSLHHPETPQAHAGFPHGSPTLPRTPKTTSLRVHQCSPQALAASTPGSPRLSGNGFAPPRSTCASPEHLWCQTCAALSLAGIDLRFLEHPLATVPVHPEPGPHPSLLDAYKVQTLMDKWVDTRRVMIGNKTLAQIIQEERYDAFVHLYRAILAKMEEVWGLDTEMSSSADED
ncbi:hypothetical protein BC834DRAFT_907740 [Gloeopeniophorella convolvens]|nr:hypothetical protein BC834DRAFT_907740 [Gloeopeniophorella convolvens]